jgi:hypothetical protein
VTGFANGETVTHVTRVRSGVDGDGNDAFTETSTVLTGVALWDPKYGNRIGNSSEIVQGQDTVISDYAMWLPATVTVTAADRFIALGDLYEVLGTPGVFKSPLTRTSGQQVNLKRVTG